MSSKTGVNNKWQESIKTGVRENLDDQIDKFAAIANKLLYCDEDVKRCSEYYVHEFNKFTGTMLIDMQKNYENTKKVNAKLLHKIHELCNYLSKEVPDFTEFANMPLYYIESIYSQKLDGLQAELDSRIKVLKVLKERLENVCTVLERDINFIHMQTSPLPSEEEIDLIKTQIENLELERNQRFEQLTHVLQPLKCMVRELGYKPRLDFEKMVLSCNVNDFRLNDDNMNRLSEFSDTVRCEYDNVSQQMASLRTKLEKLYEILQGDLDEFKTFVKNHEACSFANLKAYKEHMKDWEELRKENMAILVDKAKEELNQLYVLCGKPLLERNSLCGTLDVYSEDFLHLLELEGQNMKRYYEEHKHPISLIKKYQELVQKQKELDARADGPNRYKNRGGQLLKEEKERNALIKKIPQHEEDMRIFACEYEASHGKPFSYWGETIEEIILKNKENLEKEKKLKLSAKKQQRELSTITPSKSQLQLTRRQNSAQKSTLLTPQINLQTPSGSVKRLQKQSRMFNTPRAASSRTLAEFKQKAVKSAPAKPPVKKLRYSIEKKKRVERVRRLSKIMKEAKERSSLENNSFYEEFETDVKKECRSTMGGELLLGKKLTPHKLNGGNTQRLEVKVPTEKVELNF